jgi:hypothetical protein
MRFRIATHVTPPFVMFNPGNCSEQFCSPAAFGTDGGLTYQFMNNDVLPLLKKMCKDNGKDERVEFDWYAPYSETTSGSSPVNMVCNQGFGSLESSYQLTAAKPFCESDTKYKGAAPIDSACKGAYGTGALACNSTGPDIAVGAISITRERLDMLSFSVPMIFVEQVTNLSPTSGPDSKTMVCALLVCSLLVTFCPDVTWMGPHSLDSIVIYDPLRPI